MKTSSIIAVGLIFTTVVIAVGAWYLLPLFSTMATLPANNNGAVNTPKPPPIEHPFGVVKTKTANGFTFVTGIDAKTYTVITTANTQYVLGTSTPETAADITIGSFVSIASSTMSTDGSLKASVVLLIPSPPHAQALDPKAKK